jgi:hypothetical protein
VDDAGAVGVVERGGDLAADLDDLAGRERRLAADPLLEVLALDQLHHDVVDVAVAADVVDRDDVGVAQPRGGAGLAAKALEEFGLAAELLAEDLDGDRPPEGRVLGGVDDRHPALAEDVPEPVSPAEQV